MGFSAHFNKIGCYYKFQITQKMANGQDAVPLGVLLEKKEDRVLILELANSLHNGKFPNKGLLLCGPDGCGKFSIIWDICLIAQCELILINVDFLTYRVQDNIKNLFDFLNRNNPIIIYIPDFEDLVKNGGEFLDNFMKAFNDFKNFNKSIFLIGSTRSEQTCENGDATSILLPFKISLPSNALRKKIFKYYCDKGRIGLAYSKEREEKYQDERYNKIDFDCLVVMTYGMTGADISEIVRDAEISIRVNIPNYNSSLFADHLSSKFDFKKERGWSDAFYDMIAFPGAIISSFSDSNTQGLVMNYLITFCKIRQ